MLLNCILKHHLADSGPKLSRKASTSDLVLLVHQHVLETGAPDGAEATASCLWNCQPLLDWTHGTSNTLLPVKLRAPTLLSVLLWQPLPQQQLQSQAAVIALTPHPLTLLTDSQTAAPLTLAKALCARYCKKKIQVMNSKSLMDLIPFSFSLLSMA